MAKKLDITGKRFGRLIAISPLLLKQKGKTVWRCQCDCGNTVDVPVTQLTTGQTLSCGCLKKYLEPYSLQDGYDAKRVNDVVMPLFKGKAPRKDSSTGYRGVSEYRTRSGNDLKYRAWITVNGNKYYKSGFTTAKDAYYNGRLVLEQLYLPQIPGEPKKAIAKGKAYKNIIGQRFGRLVVLSKTDKRKRDSPLFLCQCDCGKTTLQTRPMLLNGIVKSCGCLRIDLMRKSKVINKNNTTGVRGVSRYYYKGLTKYNVQLRAYGKLHTKAGFKTLEDAKKYREFLEKTYLKD